MILTKIPISATTLLSLVTLYLNIRRRACVCSATILSSHQSARSIQVQSSSSGGNQQPAAAAAAEYSWDHNYHNSMDMPIPNNPQSNGRPTLIVQALSPGPLEELLSITSRVNRAYAKRWGFDYLSYVSSDEHANSANGGGDGYWKSCPYLLQSLLKRISDSTRDIASNNSNNGGSDPYQQDVVVYDTVMFLEANAVVVELDFNILNLIGDNSILASGAVIAEEGEGSNKWSVGSIYSDVMLWNLKHPMIQNVTASWLEAEMHASSSTGMVDTDVDISYAPAIRMLDAMKHNIGDSNVIQEIPRDMVDGLKGTLIKQGRKNDIGGVSGGGGGHRGGRGGPNGGSNGIIEESDLPKIVPVMQGISDNVCYRYYPQCEIVY